VRTWNTNSLATTVEVNARVSTEVRIARDATSRRNQQSSNNPSTTDDDRHGEHQKTTSWRERRSAVCHTGLTIQTKAHRWTTVPFSKLLVPNAFGCRSSGVGAVEGEEDVVVEIRVAPRGRDQRALPCASREVEVVDISVCGGQTNGKRLCD